MAETVSPGSLREAKRQVYADQHRGLAEAVADSELLMRDMVRHADYREGVQAWQEQRPPSWSKD